MVQESLARRFKPAGFEQPEGSRRKHIKPRPELQDAFYRWIKGLPEDILKWEDSEEQYENAVKFLEGFEEIPAQESNSLLADFKPKTEGQKEAGLFISACYAHSLENIIVFDADAPEIDLIGYLTKKNILNNGNIGDFFARESSGLAVNNGVCENCFASSSSGIAVNNGNCWNLFASGSSGIILNNGECNDGFACYSSGLAIAAKEPKGYGHSELGLTIKPADFERFPELKKYLGDLFNLSKSIKDEESAKRFLERYGKEQKERIESDIREILRNGGYKY